MLLAAGRVKVVLSCQVCPWVEVGLGCGNRRPRGPALQQRVGKFLAGVGSAWEPSPEKPRQGPSGQAGQVSSEHFLLPLPPPPIWAAPLRAEPPSIYSASSPELPHMKSDLETYMRKNTEKCQTAGPFPTLLLSFKVCIIPG